MNVASARLRKARARAKAAGWDPSRILDAQDVAAVLDGDCWYSEDAAAHVLKFFSSYLHHSKGAWAGEPFTPLPWQENLLCRLFGWLRPDGTRRYRRAGIWVPKKNGKSTMAAGIELYMLVGDDEEGAEVYIGANDKNQAGIIYLEAANMVRRSPDLRKRLQPVDSRKTIAYPGMASKLQALSADVPSHEGLNAHCVVIDELHAQKSRLLWDTLEYAGAARRQPLHISISTAGIYDITTIGWEQYEHAKRVQACELIDWSFLAMIYEADKKDDWRKPETWRKANPSLGQTIRESDFAEECTRAQLSPARQNAFRRYRLNQWVQQTTRAIDLAVWDAQKGHEVPLSAEQLAGRTCDLGLDLSSVNDLVAAVYVFEGCPDDADAVDIFCRFWVPQSRLTSDKESDHATPNAPLYQQWAEQGWLSVIPGRVIDYDFILAAIMEDAARFRIRDVNIDHLFQGHHLANKLEQEGLEVFPMRQGFLSFGPAYKQFTLLLEDACLHHGGHPVLRFCIDNAETAMDPAGNEKIVKSQGPKKVDGAVALVMAVDRWSRHGEGDGESVYDKGEPLGI